MNKQHQRGQWTKNIYCNDFPDDDDEFGTMCTLAGRPLINNACNSSPDSSCESSINWHSRAPALFRSPLDDEGDGDFWRRNGDDDDNVSDFLCFGELAGLECFEDGCFGESGGSSSMLDVLPPGLYFQPHVFQRFFCWSNFRKSFGLQLTMLPLMMPLAATMAPVAVAGSIWAAAPPFKVVICVPFADSCWCCASSAATNSNSRSSIKLVLRRRHVRCVYVLRLRTKERAEQKEHQI